MAVNTLSTSSTNGVKTRKLSRFSKQEITWGYIFLSPWIVGFLIFTLAPMLASLYFSFTNYNPIHAEDMQLIGLANYLRLFSDPMVSNSILVTLRFTLISVPLSIILPLGLAVMVNNPHLIGKNFFRSIFYMPYLIPVVVNVMVWGGVLNGNSGWVNYFLQQIFNIDGPRWFEDAMWVLPALTIMGFWGVGNTMLTMLSGLQNVPTELYEAAKVDGSGPWTTFVNITVPMISPIIFYNLVLAVIGAFQYFIQAYIISNGRGDPDGATMFYNLYLYKTAFGYLDMGYGCTLAWVMFIVVMVLTLALFLTQKKWVFYAGGD